MYAFKLLWPQVCLSKPQRPLGRPRARALISRASSGGDRQPKGPQADGEAASGAPTPARLDSPQQQLDVEEPSASTCTPEVAAAASAVPQQQAWQAVQHYIHQADAQAKRSPGATLVTVGVVAVAAMVVGSVLRRYIFGSRAGPIRPAPTVEELLLKEGLLGPQLAQPAERRQQAQQGQQQPAPVEAKLPSQPEPVQMRAQQGGAAAPAAPAAPAAATAAATAAAANAAAATAAAAEAATAAAAAAAAAQVSAEELAVTASSALAEAAAAAAVDSPLRDAATIKPSAASGPSAATAQEAQAGEEVAKEAAGEAKSGLVHPLLELQAVFVLQARAAGGAAGAAGAAGSRGSTLRLDVKVQGQELRCFVAFEDLQDAEALRRPLCVLYERDPQQLVAAAVPPAELLGGAGAQPVAFLPAGALLVLDSLSTEGMISLLKDDDEAAAFEDKLQQLLSEEAEVLSGSQVAELAAAAAAARAGSKTRSSTAAAGAAAAGSRAEGGQGPTAAAAAQEVEVEVMPSGTQQPRGSTGATGQQMGQPQPAEWRDAQAAAAAAESPSHSSSGGGGSGGSDNSSGGGSEQGAELVPDWWLSLPVVHVPQLCYDDGGKGLIVIPVASLKGALQDMASTGGVEGPAGNGASSNGNGASAVSSNGNGRSNGSGQQRDYSRPVERHIIAFQDLEDAKALSLCTLASEQGATAAKVQALAMPPSQLLQYAQSAGCAVAVLPRGEVRIEPGERLEDSVERLHDAVQDWYWRRMAEGIRQYQQDQE